MAKRIIDDIKMQNITVAIQAKNNGGQMTVDEEKKIKIKQKVEVFNYLIK